MLNKIWKIYKAKQDDEYLITNSLRICISPSMEYSQRNVRKIVFNKLGLRFHFFEFSSSMFHRLQVYRCYCNFYTFIKKSDREKENVFLSLSLSSLLLYIIFLYSIFTLTFLIDLRALSIDRLSRDQISHLFLKLFYILSWIN